jgi:hypothetical protein
MFDKITMVCVNLRSPSEKEHGEFIRLYNRRCRIYTKISRIYDKDNFKDLERRVPLEEHEASGMLTILGWFLARKPTFADWSTMCSSFVLYNYIMAMYVYLNDHSADISEIVKEVTFFSENYYVLSTDFPHLRQIFSHHELKKFLGCMYNCYCNK